MYRDLIAFFIDNLIDPITLGQPKIWATGDPNYLLNLSAAHPSNGDSLDTFNRHNDSSFNFTNSATANKPVYRIVSSKNFIGWEGDTLTLGGYYTVGSTSDLAFMHKGGSSYTVYFVFKNHTTENTSSNKVVFCTAALSSDIGAILSIINSSNNRFFNFAVYRGVTGNETATLLSTYNYLKTSDEPITIMSYRVDLSVGVGNVAIKGYKNGVLDNTVNMANTPSSSTTSTRTPAMGNRAIGNLRMDGYVGDLIIFDSLHSESTHQGVINYLKNKYGI